MPNKIKKTSPVVKMTLKKMRSFSTTGIIPYLLILLILVGLFGPMQVNAVGVYNQPQIETGVNPVTGGAASDEAKAAQEAKDKAADTRTEFEKAITSDCGFSFSGVAGCLIYLFYYTYYQVPTFLLWASALFFNFMIKIGIQSTIISNATFIPGAWAVVRDLSNIFFILVLFYVAIQIILGLSHETKKIIVRVIIIALLINFSMFFTKIVIDTSNILALVFYNKLDAKTENDGSNKDLSGKMYAKFDATRLINEGQIESLKTVIVNGQATKAETIPVMLKVGIILIAGTIMLFAAYTFFIAGLMFLGRLIELWVLIIFSPYAFISFVVPKLAGTPYIGWDEWSKRLIATSFMAPIFMLFLYLIFLLLGQADPFGGFPKTQGLIGTILSILIPAIIILALLIKATKFAEKGGGAFGEMVMKYGKMAGGLAVTAATAAATGGAGLALRKTLGAAAMRTAGNEGLKAAASGDKAHFARLGVHDTATQQKMQLAAQKKLASANKTASRSFDLRDTGIGKFIGKKSGMDFGKAAEGGYKEQEREKAKAHQERLKTYEMSGVAAQQQDKKSDEKYNNDLEEARQEAKRHGGALDEKYFNENYKAGKSVEIGEKTFQKVKNSKDINEERGKAYALSLDNASDKNDSARKAMSKWWSRNTDNFNVGAGKALDSKAFRATNALTLGIPGTVLAPLVGTLAGLVNVLKEHKAGSTTNAELVAMVRGEKIKDRPEKLLHHLQEYLEEKGGHKEKHEPAHTPPPHAPSASSPTPHTPPHTP